MEYLQYLEILEDTRTKERVLNLIINGIPSIQRKRSCWKQQDMVLNLIINGIPSIPKQQVTDWLITRLGF